MKRICILLLSAVLAATAVGQTVTGRVVDDESGEALPSASVYAKSLAKGTSTDSDGRFEMAIPEGKTVDLRISYVGYKETTIQIKSGSAPVEVRLQRGTELRDVQVYGARHDFGVKSSQMSAQVLTSQQVKEVPALFGEIDVMKSLQRLPGVQSSGDGTDLCARGQLRPEFDYARWLDALQWRASEGLRVGNQCRDGRQCGALQRRFSGSLRLAPFECDRHRCAGRRL